MTTSPKSPTNQRRVGGSWNIHDLMYRAYWGDIPDVLDERPPDDSEGAADQRLADN
jgi:hypothetical protein